jgi:thioredoxin reductase (NADPH)
VDLSKRPFAVRADDGKSIMADAIIISTGATAKWLGLESEQRLNGSGVSACAVCDGYFYRGQDVAIVGGGDSSAEEALYLSKLCNKVYMLVRKDRLRASVVMQRRVEQAPNIEIMYNHDTVEVLGEHEVSGVRVRNLENNTTRDLAITGFFVAIGHKPNTEIFKGQLDMDAVGYLRTAPDSTATNVEGVFAAGDCQDKVFRQAVTAAGTGCMAALEAERFLVGREMGE